jgi:thiamine kinase-like enzyme
MKPRALILIDTEEGFRQTFEHLLKTLKLDFVLDFIAPVVRLQNDELISDIVKRVNENYTEAGQIAAFLVDLVVREDSQLFSLEPRPSGFDRVGIRVACALRKKYPHTPIFIITGKISIPSEQALVAEASLEDVDGILPKPYLTGGGFSGERLELMLSKALIKRQMGGVEVMPNATMKMVPSNINIAGSDKAFANAMEECGTELWNLLEKLLDVGHKTIEVIQPGRSGAVVFKITMKHIFSDGSRTAPKNWIVKVAHDRALIEKEIQNYSDVKKTKLNRSSYPQPLIELPSNANGLWGIALSFEGEASTLRDTLKMIQVDNDAKRIAKCLTDTLQALYSTDPESQHGLWNHYWNRKNDLHTKLINYLNDIKTIAEEKHLLLEYKMVYEFIQTNGESCSEVSLTSVDQFETRWIHGDLNSGNVLVSTSPSNEIILIDFASAGKGHIVKDFAKLERDVYFRILDGEWTAESSDWDRMKIWMKLASIATSKTTSVNEGLDLISSERALLEFIRELRSGLVKVNSNITIREYLVGLVYYSLTAILAPEMTLQKKMFGIWFVSELLKRAKQSLQSDLLKDWANPV